jgi:hypothetical protein
MIVKKYVVVCRVVPADFELEYEDQGKDSEITMDLLHESSKSAFSENEGAVAILDNFADAELVFDRILSHGGS